MHTFNHLLIQERIRGLINTPRPSLFKVLRRKGFWTADAELTWEEIADRVFYSVERLKELNPKIAHIKKLRKGTKIVYPGKALGVSYTEEGLKHICNNRGQLLYYDGAMHVGPGEVRVKLGKKHLAGGKLRKSKDVLVENFIPHDHLFKTSEGKTYLNSALQNAEILWIDKALRMLYVPSYYVEPSQSSPILVYTTADTNDNSLS